MWEWDLPLPANSIFTQTTRSQTRNARKPLSAGEKRCLYEIQHSITFACLRGAELALLEEEEERACLVVVLPRRQGQC